MSSNLEQDLLQRLEHVNNWLMFAEAKNGVLVALTGGLIAAVGGYDNVVCAGGFIQVVFWIGMAFVIISLIVALFSFLPAYERKLIPRISRRSEPSENDNYYFYGDIAKYTSTEYLAALSHLCANTEDRSDFSHKKILDISDQLVRNSRIAVRKYELFSVGVHGLFIGVILLSSVVVSSLQ